MPDSTAPDTPAPNPQFIVPDSPLKASAITVFSLVFFGITLFGALLRLASTRDIDGIRMLLMREDTLGWLTTVAPFAWLGWRTVRSWFNRKRDAAIAVAADDSLVMTKSQVAAAIDAPPPTRARETTAPATRLVDASALLHRPGDYELMRDQVVERVQSRLDSEPLPPVDLAGGVDRFVPTADPIIPGDILSAVPAPSVDDPKDMNEAFDRYSLAKAQEGFSGEFTAYLESIGWTYEGWSGTTAQGNWDSGWRNATGEQV